MAFVSTIETKAPRRVSDRQVFESTKMFDRIRGSRSFPPFSICIRANEADGRMDRDDRRASLGNGAGKQQAFAWAGINLIDAWQGCNVAGNPIYTRIFPFAYIFDEYFPSFSIHHFLNPAPLLAFIEFDNSIRLIEEIFRDINNSFLLVYTNLFVGRFPPRYLILNFKFKDK